MKKIFLIILTFLFIQTSLPAMAQTPSEPPKKPTTPADRLKEIRDRVEERIQDIKEKTKTRAFWGTLKEITNSTLIVNTRSGERRVKTDEETKITLDKKAVEANDLEIGNFLIIIAAVDQADNLTAQRIIALSKTPKPVPARQVIFGRVSEIKSSDKILVVLPKKGTATEVKATDKTIITKKSDGSIKKVNFDEVSVGDKIVAVVLKEKEKGAFVAKLIHIIPGPKPTITTSVSPTPSPKPKPTATPTPIQ